MEIRIRSTGAVVNEHEFVRHVREQGLQQNPPVDISPFPVTLDNILAYGGDPVMEAPAPAVGDFQSAERKHGTEAAELVTKDGRSWYQQAWTIRNWGAEEISAFRDSAKRQRWDAIQAERDRRILNGGVKVVVNGVDCWFHTDVKSRSQYALLDSKAIRSSWPNTVILHPSWKTMNKNPDGSPVFVQMTLGLMRQILDAGIDQEGAIFNAAENHRIAMEAASNPATYSFSQDEAGTKWPKIFGE